MRIKRVFAADMRQAMHKVREEHGPEAVILSSRKVEGGVEVISALDYDEQAVLAAARGGDPQQPRPAPAAQARPAAQGFADTLAQVGAKVPAARPAAPSQPHAASRLDVTVDDGDEPAELRFDEPGAAAQFAAAQPAEPAAAAARRPEPASRIQWTQEPAIREMREEIRVLRSLFQDQMGLLQWQQDSRRNPVRATLLRRLTELGLAGDVARKLADHVTETEEPERAFREAMEAVRRHLRTTADDIVEGGGIVAVVGPTGVGKTTTVAKLAARYALRHGRRRVALVTTDNFRIGGQEQLRNFARILNVPVHTAGDAGELAAVLDELSDRGLVLIDTAGMSHRDMRLAAQFETLASAGRAIASYLVVSASTQVAALSEIVRAFKGVHPAACILSKVDETISLGPALSAVLRHRLPVAYLGTGQQVPEDLQPARAGALVEQAEELARQYAQPADDEELALGFGGTAHGRG